MNTLPANYLAWYFYDAFVFIAIGIAASAVWIYSIKNSKNIWWFTPVAVLFIGMLLARLYVLETMFLQ